MERYSMEVSDNEVIVYGDLTIEETFDILNYFDRKGFKCVTSGYHSALYMTRKIIESPYAE